MIQCSCGKCRLKAYSTDYFSNYINLRWFDAEANQIHIVDECPGCGESANDVSRNHRIAQKQRKAKRVQRKIDVLRAEQ